MVGRVRDKETKLEKFLLGLNLVAYKVARTRRTVRLTWMTTAR